MEKRLSTESEIRAIYQLMNDECSEFNIQTEDYETFKSSNLCTTWNWKGHTLVYCLTIYECQCPDCKNGVSFGDLFEIKDGIANMVTVNDDGDWIIEVETNLTLAMKNQNPELN